MDDFFNMLFLVVLQELGRSSDADLLCQGDILTYNCTTAFSSDATRSLLWEVSIPGQFNVTIHYTSDESLNRWTVYDNNITVILNQFTLGRYIESVLTITAASDLPLRGAEVKCTVESLSPLTIDIQHIILTQGNYNRCNNRGGVSSQALHEVAKLI